MPWSERQFRFLMSSGSPLTAAQKEKDKTEAHADPSLLHHHAGDPALRKKPHIMAARFREARH